MPFVKALRETRVITMNGDSVIVPAKTPKEIPHRLVEPCLAAGCVMCDAEGEIIFAELPEPKFDADDIPFLNVEQRKDRAKRKAVIKMAIQHIYKRNDKADFKADGLPRNDAVQQLTRFPVSNPEIMEVLEQLEAS